MNRSRQLRIALVKYKFIFDKASFSASHGRLSSLILFCMVLIFNRKIMISRFHVTVCNMLFLFLLSALKEGFVPVNTDALR